MVNDKHHARPARGINKIAGFLNRFGPARFLIFPPPDYCAR
jgi:hypothetical protein